MWGLMKMVIVIVVIMVGLGFALEYMPGADLNTWGKATARFGVKGARGSMSVFGALVAEVKEMDKQGTLDDIKTKAGEAGRSLKKKAGEMLDKKSK